MRGLFDVLNLLFEQNNSGNSSGFSHFRPKLALHGVLQKSLKVNSQQSVQKILSFEKKQKHWCAYRVTQDQKAAAKDRAGGNTKEEAQIVMRT